MSKNKKYINIACVILIIIIVVILFYYIKNNYLGVKSNKSNKINITIFGSSKININKKYFEKSRELITKLNEHKNTINVVYGGGSQGLMGEIALFKGNVISSNITKFTEHSVEDEYVFDNIQDRQRKLTEVGDMYIILPGGYGTIYELMEVLTLNDIKEIKKPIIIYNIDNFFDGFINYFDELSQKGFLSYKLNELNVRVSNNPIEVINFITQMKR